MRKKPSIKLKRSVVVKSPLDIEVPEDTILKLSELLRSTDLAEIEISLGGGGKIRVRAKDLPTAAVSVSSVAALSTLSTAARSQKPVDPHSDLHMIRSPLIGTFYRAPSPTHPPFVELRQSVSTGQTLCIVEAMKLMNEIECDCAGVLEKIFIENGTPVEFNTPLFGIRK